MRRALLMLTLAFALVSPAGATPVNRAALKEHYGLFLSARLNACASCHRPAASAQAPKSLAEFPHNAFGARLAALGKELQAANKRWDIPSRLRMIAAEDSDSDGIPNEDEILLGSNPGARTERPAAARLASLSKTKSSFALFLNTYRWRPFDAVERPDVPGKNYRNPIDSFLDTERKARGLKPRPEAPKHVLLRRVFVDLTGLPPTPEEYRTYMSDSSNMWYEKLVDSLLASPRYGERWGRHWMDVWRYSDWAGWMDQVRDSKPHIWRWRDWIIESLNADKPYDRMVQEMLAADELAPADSNALRATGYLVRNFKLLSREQWMEDVVGHTSRAFMGVTMNCAKCHDHMTDPITQADYYRMRAIFEPHNIRTDRIPGHPDTNKAGIARAFEADPKAVTYFYPRGDERHPNKERVMTPGIPAVLGGSFIVQSVRLPLESYRPHRRDFEIKETLAASESALELARVTLEKSPPESRDENRLRFELADLQHKTLLAQLKAESIEDSAGRSTDEWKKCAESALAAQRLQSVAESKLNVFIAQKGVTEAQAKVDAANKGTDKAAADKASAALAAAKTKSTETEKALKNAESETAKPLNTDFKPRIPTNYPAESTGRRLAFAKWLTSRQNPLAARVAVNHIWARHFAQGIVPSLDDFGRKGRRPTHPKLLDWLAAELMNPTVKSKVLSIKDANSQHSTLNTQHSILNSQHSILNSQHSPRWSMKHIHRLILTSEAYRMDSKPDSASLATDPDNTYLWRMPSKRLEAEVVRDSVLHVSGGLDLTMGGPEIDHKQGLESKRRSVYLRIAAEKEVEFLKIFDGPSVTECYARKPSVIPHQALALANSELAVSRSQALSKRLSESAGSDNLKFIRDSFLRILSRNPSREETRLCAQFLADQNRRFSSGPKTASTAESEFVERARRNLVLSLLNHNDFLTVR